MKIIVEQQVIQYRSKLQAQVEQRTPHSLSATGPGLGLNIDPTICITSVRHASLRYVSFLSFLPTYFLSFFHFDGIQAINIPEYRYVASHLSTGLKFCVVLPLYGQT